MMKTRKTTSHVYRGYETFQYHDGRGYCWRYGSGYQTLDEIKGAIDRHIKYDCRQAPTVNPEGAAKETTMADIQDPEAVKAKMDEAAKVAAEELKTLDPEAVTVAGNWMKAHFQKAGYKRLSRQLVAFVSVPAEAKKPKAKKGS